MRFKGLDLNLLLCLETLIEQQNVTRTAEIMGLSQPAVSAGLSRLRGFFGDPLLVQNGKRMLPTPYALRLLPAIKSILADVDALVSIPPYFNPANASRRFRICASDFLASVIWSPLLSRLASSAPALEFELIPMDDNATQRLDRGEIDILITPDSYISHNHPSELLLEEGHVVAGWNGNPLLSGPLSMESFLTAGHVAVEIGSANRMSFAESFMRSQGIHRRIEVRASSFTIIPDLLSGTKRLAVMHQRLARKVQRHYPIACSPLPFDMPPMREMIQHHRARSEDAGLLWLIEQLHLQVEYSDKFNG